MHFVWVLSNKDNTMEALKWQDKYYKIYSTYENESGL